MPREFQTDRLTPPRPEREDAGHHGLVRDRETIDVVLEAGRVHIVDAGRINPVARRGEGDHRIPALAGHGLVERPAARVQHHQPGLQW